MEAYEFWDITNKVKGVEVSRKLALKPGEVPTTAHTLTGLDSDLLFRQMAEAIASGANLKVANNQARKGS